MATKTTVLTVLAAIGFFMVSSILAIVFVKTRTREPVTLDQADDMHHHRHQDVPVTEFPPRSHAGPSTVGESAASHNGQR
ncbi:hypothetical protein [Mycobacterium sp. URHB0044]|uniref:hypothetical protein n=1 Tax=Mycobacterium sp. URHB0044 TaxID=1380386 RepID=UPI0004904678|nr:hypothetical protein [Mycobacterium sp. URHB0044]